MVNRLRRKKLWNRRQRGSNAQDEEIEVTDEEIAQVREGLKGLDTHVFNQEDWNRRAKETEARILARHL